MIDKITLKIKDFNYDSISAIMDNFRNVSITYRQDGSSLKQGNIRNMKVFLTPDLLTITGSPIVFIHGSNDVNVNNECLHDTLDELSCILDLNLFKAEVWRVDVGFNIAVKEEPQKYMELFARAPRAKKITYQQETVAFSNNMQDFVIYDKCKEIKAKKTRASALSRDIKILRAELKIKKQLKHKLNVQELTA